MPDPDMGARAECLFPRVHTASPTGRHLEVQPLRAKSPGQRFHQIGISDLRRDRRDEISLHLNRKREEGTLQTKLVLSRP